MNIPTYIGGLVASWTIQNMRKQKPNWKPPMLFIYWILFIFGFLIGKFISNFIW
jgi:hypothetical protein